jgi:hypothetical protein
MFAILEPDKFEPSASHVLNDTRGLGGRGYMTVKQNPTPSELKQGIYKPYLTLTRRIRQGKSVVMLKIQLSLPKLMYGNNFDELSGVDFDAVIERLADKLKEMGVRIWNMPGGLQEAPVSAIHYSKNVVLTDGTTASKLIDGIKVGNHSLRVDTNQTDYRNDGMSWKLHTNSYEVAYYDKLADLRQAKVSESRAIEQDNSLQLNLFDQLQEVKRQKPFEVLRMEVRLNRRQTIGAKLRKFGVDVPATFRNLYSESVAMRVLLGFLDETTSQPALLTYKPTTDEELLFELRVQNPALTANKLLTLFGLKKASESVTMRGLRQVLGDSRQTEWYRLMADVRKVTVKRTDDPYLSIRSQIENYQPLRMVDYRKEMINNDKR